jgi:hypothetical protein
MLNGDQTKGLYKKYEVKKLSNPEKQVDAIVLEFDDPIARPAIEAWAHSMNNAGFHRCAAEVFAKLLRISGDQMP